MKRIIMMVLRNILCAPYLYLKLCWYAAHTDSIPYDKQWSLIQKINDKACKGGNVEVQAYGVENIPKEGGFMFFPNHQGMFDVLAIIKTCPRYFSVVVKRELENIFFLNKIFPIMGYYAIDRDDVRQSMKVIQNVSKDVADGKPFLIFAEGTRSRDGNHIGEFKGGSFKSAQKAKCPIIPVAVIDSYKVMDTHSLDKVTVQIHYLEPLFYEEYKMMKTPEIAEIVESRIKKTIDIYDSN
ncbi:MAG: 1-acyl-sn-glycerol-3-phosphate acyltransferase [Clostridiales bacterium]|nr:1-acyl-sn-glycerol-3-phosphate acyltransferase [Clostridiales bacterium]